MLNNLSGFKFGIMIIIALTMGFMLRKYLKISNPLNHIGGCKCESGCGCEGDCKCQSGGKCMGDCNRDGGCNHKEGGGRCNHKGKGKCNHKGG